MIVRPIPVMHLIPWLTLPTPVGKLDLGGWNLLWALLVGVGTILCARYASRAVSRYGNRLTSVPDDTVLGAARISRYVVYFAGLALALAVLGAPIRPLVILLAVVAGAAVLLGRGIADNLGAGLLIQTRRTVKLGDLVESAGQVGHITDLNSRSVVIDTLHGVTVHLPNKQLLEAPLLNYSARGATRSEIEVRISLSRDEGDPGLTAQRLTRATATKTIDTLTSLVAHAASETRGVHKTPAPDVLVKGFDPTRVVLHLRIWHDPDAESAVCSRASIGVIGALDAQGLPCAVAWPPPAAPLTDPGPL